MYIFWGSFSYVSIFKTLLKIIYEVLIVLSSITKKGEIESASRPPSRFWCLNDKTIKELMSFSKCEIGKMSCDYVEAIHSSRHMLWPI
jgi:hypothetical protein